MNQALRSYIAEFLGTFTLVFVGTAVATLQGMYDHGPIGPVEISLAFGFTLMLLVWVLGPVSGCHINPAVTLPMAMSGRFPWSRVPGYFIAQFVGATAASGVLLFLLKGLNEYKPELHHLGANGNPKGMTIGSLFGFELVLTALFLMTIFSTTRKDAIRGFEGWAIGGFLLVAHLIGAQLGDSSLNPARSFGPAVFEGGDALSVLWVFIVAPFIGGIVGWRLFALIHDE
ncbi:MAG TPA: MIP family channel protein [Pirellulales bacterium]|nr:MIP family channel protein [Pirellulales bacterium]